MERALKKLLLIAGAAFVLPLAAQAQTYKIGDRHPGGGLVIEVDAAGKKGTLIDEADSGPFTPLEAIAAAKAKGSNLPKAAQLKAAYAQLHKSGKGNFKPAMYQSADASSAHYRIGIDFATGAESTGVAQNHKVLVRFTKAFDAPPTVASVFPLSRETRFEPGRKYPSPSGKHYLSFQGDGNLVVATQDGKPVWALNSLTPNWPKNGYAVFQADGNLATYQNGGAYVWSARHVPSPAGTTLTLNDKGELQIIGPDGKPLWTGTAN